MPRENSIETEKMARFPGIIFADGPAGRRARLAGTGIEVFEIAQTYLSLSKDRDELERYYDWLPWSQVRQALRYYEENVGEIEAFLTDQEPEDVRREWQAYFQRERQHR